MIPPPSVIAYTSPLKRPLPDLNPFFHEHPSNQGMSTGPAGGERLPRPNLPYLIEETLARRYKCSIESCMQRAKGRPDTSLALDIYSLLSLVGLNNATTKIERRNALQAALHTFSHDNEEVHNLEIELGADKVLCLKLGYTAVSLPNSAFDVISAEINLICQCLLQVYKCSQQYRTQSFHNIGASEIIPILVRLSTRTIETEQINDTRLAEAGGGLVHCLAVLRVFAKLVLAKAVVIKISQEGLIAGILGRVKSWILGSRSLGLFSCEQVLWESLGMIKDLAFRSQAHDKAVLLQGKSESLLQILVLCGDRFNALHSKLQEWYTAVVWNLALDQTTRDVLVERCASGIINGLIDAVELSSNTRKSSNVFARARRNAVSALGNIIGDPRCQGRTSASLLALFPSLMNVIENEHDHIVRRRAMRIIRSLVSSSNHVLQKYVWENSVVLTSFLGAAISETNPHEIDDGNENDARIQACRAIVAMSDVISADQWPPLRNTLVKRIEMTTSPKLIAAASHCLALSIKKGIRSWQSSLLPDLLWKRLETAVSTDATSHEEISCFLDELAKLEMKARNPECGGTLSRMEALNAMATILSHLEPSKGSSKDRVLRAISLLVQESPNKKAMAENERLLSALVSLCITQPTEKIKDDAKKIILELVPEI